MASGGVLDRHCVAWRGEHGKIKRKACLTMPCVDEVRDGQCCDRMKHKGNQGTVRRIIINNLLRIALKWHKASVQHNLNITLLQIKYINKISRILRSFDPQNIIRDASFAVYKKRLSEVGFEPTPGEPDCDLNAAP